MGEIRKLPLLLLLLVCGSTIVGGCGDGEATGETETTAKQGRLYPWIKGPDREFLIRGGDNAIQLSGHEATEAEREQASRVIHAWMKARAAQDWAQDCRYFSRQYIHTLVAEDAVSVSKGKATNCPQALAFFGHLASGNYNNNLSGPIDSMRVSEGHGYAQYHGNDGHDWIISLDKERGKWWVAIASPVGRSR